MTTQRKMTSQSVKAIMQQRTLVPEQAINKRVKLTVQGNGNVIDVKNKQGDFVPSAADPNLVLQKKIYNFKANSGLAMASDRNKQLLKDAIKAEKAGESEKAHDLFNDYLNRVQLSAGILLPNSVVEKLASGVEIAATIVKVTTDNGSLLTIDPSSISVVEPESYGKTSFDLSDFTDEEEEDATTETVADVFAGLDRKALIAKAKELGVTGLTKTSTDEQIKAAITAMTADEEL